MYGRCLLNIQARLSVAASRGCHFQWHVIPVNTSKLQMFNKPEKNLLSTQTPLQVQRRTTTMDNAIRISLESPQADYKRLMNGMLDENLQDDAMHAKYKIIAQEARNVIWKLLFDDPQPPSAEREKKAGDLLKDHKLDACYFVPWDYNDWIVGVRDELLKRELLDFWRDVIVKEQLGLCCYRDSDYFDDSDDPEPGNFYRYAGCKPAWETKTNDHSAAATVEKQASAATLVPTPSTTPLGDYTISMSNPLDDYKRIIKVNISENTSSNDEQVEKIYSDIATSARKTAWALLFDEPQPPSVQRQSKAGDLLREHKTDAGFYAPWIYNEWVYKLKDEILKRNLLDFWRNQMVKRELGLCWARDSDYFDDMEDPEPAKFYDHAGCVAVWIKEEQQNRENERKSGDGQ